MGVNALRGFLSQGCSLYYRAAFVCVLVRHLSTVFTKKPLHTFDKYPFLTIIVLLFQKTIELRCYSFGAKLAIQTQCRFSYKTA